MKESEDKNCVCNMIFVTILPLSNSHARADAIWFSLFEKSFEVEKYFVSAKYYYYN